MKTIDEKPNVLKIIDLDGHIEELELIVAPAVATSPGPLPEVWHNHNHTMVSEPRLELTDIEEMEELIAPSGLIVPWPHSGMFVNHNETMVNEPELQLADIEELEAKVAPDGGDTVLPLQWQRHHN